MMKTWMHAICCETDETCHEDLRLELGRMKSHFIEESKNIPDH